MNYIEFPLQHQAGGSVAEVSLTGVESDVFLVDSTNLSAFKRGSEFRYHGGHYKSSPVRLRVPPNGTWTVIVIPSQGGTVHATVRVLVGV
jgi:Domain of unknown function (DUF1883)